MISANQAQKQIKQGNKEAALAWLEQVGSWPSSDPEIREITNAANRLLGFPLYDPDESTD